MKSAINSMVNAKGDDGIASLEDHASQQHCNTVRHQCIDKLERLMTHAEMFTARDVAAYRERALSDRALESAGIRTAEEKLAALQQNADQYIPETIERVTRAEAVFHAGITRAQANGWITSETAAYWNRKLKSNKMPWWEKEEFLQKKFPRFLKNWETMTKDIQKVKEAAKKDSSLAAIPEVALILSKKSSLKNYREWRNAVHEALGAIEAHRYQRTRLYGEAKKILQKAASDQVLAGSKIGTWLQRIFETNASTEKIVEFIRGSGPKSLEGLISRWAQVRERFDKVEGMRQKQGTPRGFHFVTTDKFLRWHYSKRLAYVDEAEKRFTDIAKEHPLILDIRRELDCEDWASAAALIRTAELEIFNPKDREKLRSMKNYLHENQKSGEQTQDSASDAYASPQEELDAMLLSLPPALQPLYRKAFEAGKGECLFSLMYNRVWCREKGQALDDRKEAQLREHATEETKYRLEHGDTKGHIASDVNSYQEPSIRSYTYTGVNKSQTLFANAQGHGALVAKMEKEDSYLFRYWTTLIPEGVDYSTHAYIVKNLHHRMKKCLRSAKSASAPTVKKQNKAVKTLKSYGTSLYQSA